MTRTATAVGVAVLAAAVLVVLSPLIASALVSTYAPGGWYWQNPLPTGVRLNGVRFADTSRGWAVGDYGTIMRTSDGGATWQFQSSPTSKTLAGIDSVSPDNALVVGEAVVMSTGDGGATWQRMSGWLDAVDMATVATGWGCTYGGLYRTSDFGNSWQRALPNDSISFNDVFALDQQHVWSVATTVTGFTAWGAAFRTTDGENWSFSATLPMERPTGIAFSDASNGAAVGTDNVPDSGSVVHTTDGGVTWTPIVTGTAELYAVDFGSSTIAVAVGAGGTVWRTGDGGATWSKSPSVDTSGSLRAVDMLSAFAGWAVGDGGVIAKTSDGGLTWSRQTTWSVNGLVTSVYFADDTNGWAAGTGAFLRHTTDGGATWSPQALPSSVDVNDLAFTSPATGWAGGSSSALFRTGNGGATWVQQVSPSFESSTDIVALSFADATRGWAAGSYRPDPQRGFVRRTADGGANWTNTSFDSTTQVQDMDFVTTRTGCVVGSLGAASGAISYTNDGGDSWTTTETTFEARGVDLVSPTEGWVVGQRWYGPDNGPVILHTADGGATWQRQTPPPGAWRLKSVMFLDALRGWVAGDNGSVGFTTDGGATWQRADVGTHGHLRSVWATRMDRAWVAGANGAILSNFDLSPSVPPTEPPGPPAPPPTGSLTTSLTLSRSRSVVSYNGTVLLRATLRAGGAPLAGQAVTVLKKSSFDTTFTTSGAAMYSPATKTYDATRRLTADTLFRIVYAGDAGHLGSASARLLVRARASLTTPSSPSVVTHRRRFSVRGTMRPRHTGRVYLRLYRWTGRAWAYRAQVRLLLRNGPKSSTTYYGRVSLPTAGRWRLRAYHADSSHYPTTSGARNVRAR